MSPCHPEILVDHIGGLSSTKERILFVSFLNLTSASFVFPPVQGTHELLVDDAPSLGAKWCRSPAVAVDVDCSMSLWWIVKNWSALSCRELNQLRHVIQADTRRVLKRGASDVMIAVSTHQLCWICIFSARHPLCCFCDG